MFSSLRASQSRSHGSFALKDVMPTIFSCIKNETWKSRVLFISFDWKADTILIILICSMFQEIDFGLWVFRLPSNFKNAFINIFSHTETLCVLSSNSMLSIVEFSFSGRTSQCAWVAGWFDEVMTSNRSMVNNRAGIHTISILKSLLLLWNELVEIG